MPPAPSNASIRLFSLLFLFSFLLFLFFFLFFFPLFLPARELRNMEQKWRHWTGGTMVRSRAPPAWPRSTPFFSPLFLYLFPFSPPSPSSEGEFVRTKFISRKRRGWRLRVVPRAGEPLKPFLFPFSLPSSLFSLFFFRSKPERKEENCAWDGRRCTIRTFAVGINGFSYSFAVSLPPLPPSLFFLSFLLFSPAIKKRRQRFEAVYF